MRIQVGVENFGKIQSAKIDISNFAVFVGDNNSGKTYLMQLIYGLCQYFVVPEGYVPICSRELLDKIKSNARYMVSNDDIELLCEEINHCLNDKKDLLVEKIFQKKVNIEKIYIECEVEEHEMEIMHFFSKTPSNGNEEGIKYESWNVYRYGEPKAFFGVDLSGITYERLLNLVLFSFGVGYNNRLYLPSSRTGIQLLYKEFYAQKLDGFVQRNENRKEDIFGLTLPVYEFMRFLQTYKMNSDPGGKRIVDFIDDHIIMGHLSTSDTNNIEYIPKDNSVRVPIYLASSMINELSPIAMAFSSGKFFDCLLIDEVETSLHPKMQREMARLLCRINNLGTKLIVSTHSDTMAAYINLFVLLANKHSLSIEKKKALGIDDEDILSNKEVSFYQFNDYGDKSMVKELPYSVNLSVGVDFELFNESLERLYNDSKALIGE